MKIIRQSAFFRSVASIIFLRRYYPYQVRRVFGLYPPLSRISFSTPRLFLCGFFYLSKDTSFCQEFSLLPSKIFYSNSHGVQKKQRKNDCTQSLQSFWLTAFCSTSPDLHQHGAGIHYIACFMNYQKKRIKTRIPHKANHKHIRLRGTKIIRIY